MAKKKKKATKKKGGGGQRGRATSKTAKAKRAKFDEVVVCPCCERKIRVRAYRNIKTKAVPAVVELDITVEPENQKEFDLGLPEEGGGAEATEE